MHRPMLAGATLAAALFAMSSGSALADEYSARLSGFNEVGALNAETGAVLSNGHGTLKLTLDSKANTLSYTLSFSDLSTPVTQAHIHFGKVHTPGGVMVFFCTNLGNGPAGTPACPANGGTVSGSVGPAGVVGPAAQNVTPGDFEAVEAALGSDTVYANIHTTKFPAGEIRGQVHRARHDDD